MPQPQAHYRQEVFFTTPVGPDPSSPCEFEDDKGLFHWLKRDILLITPNPDWPV